MKRMKKTFALLLACVLVLALGVPAFAANSTDTKGSITIDNPQDGEMYTAYRIFDVTYDLGSTGTTDDKYAYTIVPEWVDDVVAYATPSGTTLATDWTSTTANGLTVTKAFDSANNVTKYIIGVDLTTFSAADFGEKMAAKTSGKSVKFSFTDGKATNLPLGYYMVQPTTANSLVSLTTTDKDVKVHDKNEKPEVDKKLADEAPILICEKEEHTHGAACYTDPTDTTTLTCTKEEHTHDEDCYKEKEYATASIGDTVKFELDTKVPDMTGYDFYFFVVNDTMSKGLTFNENVVIKIGGEDQTQKTLEKGTDYTVKVTENADGTTGIRIVFKDMKTKYWSDDESKDWAGEPIVITYAATVNESAVTGSDGNNNKAHVEYSRDPNIKPEYEPTTPPEDKNDPLDPKYEHNDPGYTGEDPIGESADDEVIVYTTELDITKVDAASTTTTLKGAKFKIEGDMLDVVVVNKKIFEKDNTNGTYWRLTDGTYTKAEPVSEAKDPTYTEKTSFEPVTFEELTGAAAAAGVGLYYSTDSGMTKTLITDSNLSYVPDTDVKIYRPTYKTPGLYYLDSSSYVEVTEANCATVYTGDTGRKYYTKTEYKLSTLYENTAEKYKLVEVIDKSNTGADKYEAEGFVDENGLITFKGLNEGTYYITELVAPDGYNILKKPVKVEIELVAGSAADTYKFQVKVDGSTTPISESSGHLSFDVENSQGVELPETGGAGTTLFVTIGMLAVITAGIFLVTNQRMKKEGF